MAVEPEGAAGGGWIDELAALGDDGRRQAFLAARADLHVPRSVERLSEEVLRRLRVDLEEARRLAAAARWLAAELGDERCRALALKSSGHADYLTGAYERAVERYREAERIFRGLGREVEAAVTLTSALQALSYVGRYREAERAAAAARTILERRGERLLLARLETNEGNILVRLDRHAEALERYERALEHFRSHGDPQDVAAALLNIMVCCIELNAFQRALAAHEELRGHCERHCMPLVAARADYNVAYLHYLRGEYARAIELYQLTRERGREAGDPYDLALCDLDQAEIYLELNLTEEGERLAELAFAAFEKLIMGYEAAKALAFRAVAAHQKGAARRALELFAAARRRFADEGNVVWSATVDLYRALILFAKIRLPEARSLARETREVFLESRQVHRAALCELLLARIALRMGRPQEAREVCLQAIERLEALDIPASLSKTYFALGQIEEARGDRAAAFRAYRQAQHTLESLRSQLRGEELKIAFFADKLEVYESLVRMTLEGKPRPQDVREALTCVEQAKSRSLADLMAFGTPPLPAAAGVHGELTGEIRRLREDLNWYYRQIARRELELMPGTERDEHEARAARLEDLRRRCREHEERFSATLGELRAGGGELGSLQVAAALDPDAIRAALPPRAVLLEYYEARGKIYAFVVGRDRLEAAALTTSAKVRDLQRLLQFQLSKFRLGSDYLETFGERLRRATLNHLADLYRELVAPVAASLTARDLVVVPHGSLHYLPFHAFYDGERFLLDRFSVSYAPSASVFAMCCARRAGGHRQALVLGVPDPLTPNVVEEVEAVAASLPGSRLLLGAEATEESLRTLAPRCRLIHVATHGYFRRDSPMFSAIQLGTSRLTLFDLYHLELGADLVVLSGCATGLNVVETGDELIGLTRGLLYAGAQSVLVSLWDVHDRSTADFMTALYRHLGTHRSRAQAVKLAMQDLRRRYPHPYYWAPFVLIGKPFAD